MNEEKNDDDDDDCVDDELEDLINLLYNYHCGEVITSVKLLLSAGRANNILSLHFVLQNLNRAHIMCIFTEQK